MGALALLPADSMFVARVDLALLRATTAFEAMAALPGAPQEALAAFLAIDQVYVSVGPMVEAHDAFRAATDPSVATGGGGQGESDASHEVAPGTLEEAAEASSTRDEVQTGETPESADPDVSTSSEDSDTPDDEPLLGTLDPESVAWWSRWFGTRVPGFMVVIVPHEGSLACERLFEGLTPVPWEGGRRVVTKGVVAFETVEGLCGATLPTIESALSARQGLHSPAVVRLLRELRPTGDLGLVATAIEGGGALLRTWLAAVSADVRPTERRVVDWLSRVSVAWNRGILGSTHVVRVRNQAYDLESRYEYDDPRRASAHEIIANTLREITDITVEAIAAESEGMIPMDVGDRLQIERSETMLTLRWAIAEETVANVVEAMIRPMAAAATVAAPSEGVSEDSDMEMTLALGRDAEERISILEPRLSTFESTSNGAEFVRALASAYAVRGRFDSAIELYERLRSAPGANGDSRRDLADDLAVADIELMRGDVARAAAVLAEASRTFVDDDACGVSLVSYLVMRARVARLEGDFERAERELAHARSTTSLTLKESLEVIVEQAQLDDARGESGRALDVLDAVSSLMGHLYAADVSSLVPLTQIEILTHVGRVEEALGAPAASATQGTAYLVIDRVVVEADIAFQVCRAQSLLASGRRASEKCGAALQLALRAHGEVHPRVARARLAVAGLLLLRGHGSQARAEFERADAALASSSPQHPLREELARLRTASVRRGR